VHNGLLTNADRLLTIVQATYDLVKWEGFGVEHNSWEPWDNVRATADDLVEI